MENNYSYQHLDEEVNIPDLQSTVDSGDMVGIVCEENGGIIAYANSEDHADTITSKLNDADRFKELLDQIQTDLADYQNENGIGTMDDRQWQQLFVERVTATITSYETKD